MLVRVPVVVPKARSKVGKNALTQRNARFEVDFAAVRAMRDRVCGRSPRVEDEVVDKVDRQLAVDRDRQVDVNPEK